MSGGDVAKVAVPMALTVASGGVLAPALAPALGTLGAGIAAGAAAGATGAAITGGDPLTGAALGGIGGGLAAPGSIFGGGTEATASGVGNVGAEGVGQAATTEAAATAGQTAPAATQGIGGFSGDEMLSPSLAQDMAASEQSAATASLSNKADLALANPGASMINYAQAHPMSVIGSGLGGYMMNGSQSDQEQPIGREERKINNVAPLKREQLAIDPNAFSGIGGARSGYVKANPNTVYLAKGGPVIPSAAPTMPDPSRALGGIYHGAGDGQSDTIPAMVCDGEYFISAPVVSAIGRGSNDAGAKKLDKMQKQIMAKTYKKGKPPAAGLGSMRVA